MDDAGFYDDLDASLDEAWAQLVRGAADRRSGMHTVQVATAGADGPRLRTVVLRGADAATRTIRFHTDIRSEKAAHLLADPRIELCAYDPAAKLQLRLRGEAALHTDGPLVEAAWAATSAGSRVCYRAALGPGTPLDHPAEGDPAPAARNPDDPGHGRAVFAAVSVTVGRIDWLYLASRGHRRAAFDWTSDGWRGRWLAP